MAAPGADESLVQLALDLLVVLGVLLDLRVPHGRLIQEAEGRGANHVLLSERATNVKELLENWKKKKSNRTGKLSTSKIAELTALLAEPGRGVADGLPGGAVDDLRLAVVDDPVDAVVVRLGGLPRLRGGRGVEVGRGDLERLGQVGHKLRDPLVEGAAHVARVELGADRDGLEVDRLDQVGEEGALDAEDVPAEDLVRAGHGEEPVPGHDPVPGLDQDLGVDGHGAHAALDLGAESAPTKT